VGYILAEADVRIQSILAMKAKVPNPEEQSARLTLMRQSLTRGQAKYSAGGREKRRGRAVPSMPKFKCLGHIVTAR
jgi:hypothetical protein